VIADMSPQAVEARLLEASRLAGSWRSEARLETKVDMRGPAIAARLKERPICSMLSRTIPKSLCRGKRDEDSQGHSGGQGQRVCSSTRRRRCLTLSTDERDGDRAVMVLDETGRLRGFFRT